MSTSSFVFIANTHNQNSGIEKLSLADTLLEEYERTGIVDDKQEFLIKTATGQLYGGTSPGDGFASDYIIAHHPNIPILFLAAVETVSCESSLLVTSCLW